MIVDQVHPGLQLTTYATALDAWSDHLQKLVGLSDVVLIDASSE